MLRSVLLSMWWQYSCSSFLGWVELLPQLKNKQPPRGKLPFWSDSRKKLKTLFRSRIQGWYHFTSKRNPREENSSDNFYLPCWDFSVSNSFPMSAAANEPSQECSTDTCFDQCTTSDHNRDPYRPPIPNYPSSNEWASLEFPSLNT